MFISNTAENWLQEILRRRINDDLDLKLIRGSNPYWKLSLRATQFIITAPYYSDLYKLGPDRNMIFSIFKSKEYNFFDDNDGLILLGKKFLEKKLIKNKLSDIHINYDVFGLIYRCLSRAEEVFSKENDLDNHSRFTASLSHAYFNNYLDRPIVDEWIDFLKKLIKKSLPNFILKKNYYSICLSHDVDYAGKFSFLTKKEFIKYFLSSIIKRLDFKTSYKIINCFFNKSEIDRSDPWNTFDFLMDLSEKIGIKSNFNFMTGITDKKHDGNYDFFSRKIRNLIIRIKERNHDIGFHPSYKTFNCFELFSKEANIFKNFCEIENINQENIGGRMHVLRWSHPKTAYFWQDSNFDYDSSLGYPDCPGFRCGTSHEFQMFDPICQKILDVYQKPLIAMECSITAKRYLNITNEDKAISIIKNLKNKCKKYDGTFSLLWHNSHLEYLKDINLYKKSIKI